VNLFFFCADRLCEFIFLQVNQIDHYIYEIYRRFRLHPVFRNVPFLYIVENMTGNDAATIAGMAARDRQRDRNGTSFRMYGYRFLSQHPGKLGFCTTAPSKLEGFMRIRDKATSYGIKFWEGLVSVGMDHGHGGTGREEMRTMLISQIANLRQYGKTKKGHNEVKVSAIMDENDKRIKNRHDDLLMGLKFIALWGALQRDGGLSVKPDDVDRMRHTMVHEEERVPFMERATKSITHRLDEETRRIRRDSLLSPRRPVVNDKK